MKTIATITHPFQIAWANDAAQAAQIADFFYAHASVDYISHSELQYGRALAPGLWSPDLRAQLYAQAQAVLAHAPNDGSADAIACVHLGTALVGIAFVSFGGSPQGARFAMLEDVIISPAQRGQRVGQQLVDWIIEAIRAWGIRRVFLESGVDNHAAHHFFERNGFRQASLVMMRDID